MSKIYTAADQLIGHTPLLELTHIEAAEGLEAKLLAKLEYFNPAGSVKDRIAKAMLDDAEAAGQALHDGDADVVGVDDLLIRKVIRIIQKKSTDAASGKSKNQSITVCTHHISSDSHSCFKKFFAAQRSVLFVNFINGTADRHGDIHNGSET